MGSAHDHHFHYIPPAAGDDARYLASKRVTLIGAVINLLLALGKGVVGWIAQSQALVADAVHSLSDLVTDVMVVIAAKHGSRDADETHPYGHARIETAVTVALGVILILVGAGIAWDAISRLFDPNSLLVPGALALVAAAVSVLAKEGLYRYTLVIARRVRSNLLRANAWHHRTDAISSIVVIVGVAGTMAGLPYLDAIAAVAVALMIAKVGWDLAWHSLRELVDTALDEERVEAIRETITGVDGVESLHMLRTRRMGSDALADVHILVNPEITVSEGHHISETVRTRVIDRIPEVQDVLVHIDPEDDETTRPSVDLPQRHELEARLRASWEALPGMVGIDRIALHYLDGKVSVDVYLSLGAAESVEELRSLGRRLQAAAAAVEDIGAVRVYYF